MSGRHWRYCALIAAVVTAACGGPTFTSRNAADRHPAPTDAGQETRIGDAAVLDRSGTTTIPAPMVPTTTAVPADYPRGVSSRMVDGLEVVMQANEAATFRHDSAVHLVLSVTNKTNHSVGYLTNRETHFALVDGDNKTLWTDETCRAKDTETTFATGYLEIAPGEHISVDDYYPIHPGANTKGCAAPPGKAWLTGAMTVCRNLNADWSCRGASSERVQAAPIAVNVT